MDSLKTTLPKWIVIRNGALLDPWGRTIKIGMDLDHDGFIGHGKDSTGVWRKNGSLVAIGVYSAVAEKATGINGSAWNTEGGVIEAKSNPARQP